MEKREDSFVYLHAEVLPEKLQETERKKKRAGDSATSDNISSFPWIGEKYVYICLKTAK